MENFLERVRAKPEHVRSRYAFLSSFGITFIIFAFWIGSFGVYKNHTGAVAAALEKTSTPSQNLTASVGSFFIDLKELVFGAKKITYTSIEVSAGKKSDF